MDTNHKPITKNTYDKNQNQIRLKQIYQGFHCYKMPCMTSSDTDSNSIWLWLFDLLIFFYKILALLPTVFSVRFVSSFNDFAIVLFWNSHFKIVLTSIPVLNLYRKATIIIRTVLPPIMYSFSIKFKCMKSNPTAKISAISIATLYSC